MTLWSMLPLVPGRPPSWSQNEVKVLIDAESSLYSSSIETPGPGEKMFCDPGLAISRSCHQPGAYIYIYCFPFSVYNPGSLVLFDQSGCSAQPRAAAAWPGAPGAHARCSRRFGQRYQRELLYMAQVTSRLEPLREELGSA